MLIHCTALLAGLIDSLAFPRVLAFLMASRRIRRDFTNCFVLNVLVFTGLACLKEFCLARILPAWLMVILSYPVLVLTYLVSSLVSSFWFSDIAAEAMRLVHKKGRANSVEQITMTSRIHNEIYHFLFLGSFLLQSTLLSTLSPIPTLASLIKTIHLSFLYSLACFEYKWGTDSNLMHNLSFFQHHLSYFVGFGMVFALVCMHLPFWLATSCYAALFPLFLLTALPAAPPDPTTTLTSLLTCQPLSRLSIHDHSRDSPLDYSLGIFYPSHKATQLIHDYLQHRYMNRLLS